jgi:hypothetical protein
MTLEEAVAKYGTIIDGHWANAANFSSILNIPPEIAENWINSVSSAPTLKIYCNKDIQEALLKALQNIRDRGLLAELKTFDGCSCVRDIRGEPGKPSAHSYGLAVDINAATNQLGTRGDMVPQIIECFTQCGFVWGGNFTRSDPMHFSWGW